MKKKISIIVGAIVLVLASMAVLPFLYKDKVLNKVKAALNEQVNAKVDFAGFSMSLFADFPKVAIKINRLSLTGIHDFENDTLFSAKLVAGSISLMNMIGNEELELKSLSIDGARVLLVSNQAGKANWDIAKDSKEVQSGAEQASSDSFKMKMSDIRVRDLLFGYRDEASPVVIWLKNSNIDMSGRLEGAVTHFDLKGDVGEFVFEYDSVRYISKTSLKAETKLKADLDKMDFGFEQGKLMVNNLPLDVAGSFSMPNDSMFFDLGFKSAKSDFETILSLLPADYHKYIEKAEIRGSAAFVGSVKGLFYNDIYPAIDLSVVADNASFKYQGLPESVYDINVLAKVSKPEGSLDLLKVDVEKARATIKSNPIALRLQVSEPMTDPLINGSVEGTVDFSSLKQAIPIDSLDVAGLLKINMQLSGRMSSVEKQEYEKFKAGGEATLTDFRAQSKQLLKPIEINAAQVKANTAKITIDRFDGKIGVSSFSVRGEVSDYLLYTFRNGVLKGKFNLKSDFMDFSELMSLQKKQDAKKSAEPAPAAASAQVFDFQVPDRLDLSFSPSIKKAVFDQVQIDNISGLARVKNKQLELSDIAMEILQGKMVVNGLYDSSKAGNPLFGFKLDMQKLDLPTACQSFSTFRHYLPIASQSQGKFTTQFALSGSMNGAMGFEPASLNGSGLFNIQNLTIVDSPVFDQIRGVIKKEKLKNVKVDDFTTKFQFENGMLKVDPFKTNIAGQQATIQGNLSATREINMTMDFVVNREDLGADINKGLDILPGSQNIKLIDASVVLKGPLAKPEVSLDLSKARAQIEQQVKKATVDEVKESVKKLGNELKKLFK